MESLALSLVKSFPALSAAPMWAVSLALMVAAGVVVLVFALTFEGVGSLVLRKVAGDIQARIGPNRAWMSPATLRSTSDPTPSNVSAKTDRKSVV